MDVSVYLVVLNLDIDFGIINISTARMRKVFFSVNNDGVDREEKAKKKFFLLVYFEWMCVVTFMLF